MTAGPSPPGSRGDRLRLSADHLTFLGLLCCALAGFAAAGGWWRAAASAALLAGGLDMMDGWWARRTHTAGPAGALLDSSLDRYGDALLYTGLVVYFSREGSPGGAVWCASGLAAAFTISYVRARSEGLGIRCTIGFWERPERMAIYIWGLACANPLATVIVLGSLPHWTALRRLLHGRALLHDPSGSEGEGDHSRNRRTLAYGAAMAALFGVLLVFRP